MDRHLRSLFSSAASYLRRNQLLAKTLFVLVVLGVSHATYFRKHYLPTVTYWDEPYHITSAARYIQKLHFMEPHPPLGKMLIAWGELLLNPNEGKTFGFERREVTPLDMPDGFSFAGYRFFPALAAWLCALVFALLLVELLGSRLWALAFLALFAFDNALVLQLRGAMLDSFMLLGSLLCLLGFSKVIKRTELSARSSFWPLLLMIFGFSFAVLTKVLALIFILLWPLLFLIRRKKKADLIFLAKASFVQLLFFLFFFCSVWSYHLNSAQRVDPSLKVGGLYYASSDYEKILTKQPHTFSRVEGFLIGLRDNLRFFKFYEDGVESYDLDKGNTTASFPISWPFGSRPIVYRTNYPDEPDRRYLVLIPNMLIWGLGLMGVILSFGGLALGCLTRKRIYSSQATVFLASLSILYLSYMLSVSFIRRALYLNHYIIPLILSFLMLAIVVQQVYQHSQSTRIQRVIPYFLGLLPVATLSVFLFFKPFTYFEALSCEEGNRRILIPYWSLKLTFCPDPYPTKKVSAPRPSRSARELLQQKLSD